MSLTNDILDDSFELIETRFSEFEKQIVEKVIQILNETLDKYYTKEEIDSLFDEVSVLITNLTNSFNNSVSEIRNAGVYTLDLEIVDDNYYGTATLDYTVHRAKYRDITHNDFIETYYEGIKLSDFVLDEGFKYACDDEELFLKKDHLFLYVIQKVLLLVNSKL